MIDFWELAKDFKTGDAVQKYMPPDGSLSPFTGMVKAVHPGLGQVDVQWPFGASRESPDELVRVNPQLVRFLPPSLDQAYSAYDINKARKTANWRTTEVPPEFHRELARLWARKANEVAAYDELWHRFSSGTPDAVLRDEVAKFYRFAQNQTELRIQQHAAKTAAYWVAQNRQYRVTSDEFQSRRPACPKCGTKMRRTTYKMTKGQRERLFACPKDLFLIRRDDILGPGGEPVEW